MPMRSSYLKLISNVFPTFGFFWEKSMNLLSNIVLSSWTKMVQDKLRITLILVALILSLSSILSPSPTRSHFHAGSVNSLDIPATAYKLCSNEFSCVLFHVLLWFFYFSFFSAFCLLALVTFIVFSRSMKHKRQLAFPSPSRPSPIHLFDLFVC